MFVCGALALQEAFGRKIGPLLVDLELLRIIAIGEMGTVGKRSSSQYRRPRRWKQVPTLPTHTKAPFDGDTAGDGLTGV